MDFYSEKKENNFKKLISSLSCNFWKMYWIKKEIAESISIQISIQVQSMNCELVIFSNFEKIIDEKLVFCTISDQWIAGSTKEKTNEQMDDKQSQISFYFYL